MKKTNLKSFSCEPDLPVREDFNRALKVFLQRHASGMEGVNTPREISVRLGGQKFNPTFQNRDVGHPAPGWLCGPDVVDAHFCEEWEKMWIQAASKGIRFWLPRLSVQKP